MYNKINLVILREQYNDYIKGHSIKERGNWIEGQQNIEARTG